MRHVRVCLRFIPVLTVASVAQVQELEVLPVGDFLQLWLITEMVFHRC